ALQRSDLLAHGRLREPEAPRRGRDAALADDGPEVVEVVVVEPFHRSPTYRPSLEQPEELSGLRRAAFVTIPSRSRPHAGAGAAPARPPAAVGDPGKLYPRKEQASHAFPLRPCSLGRVHRRGPRAACPRSRRAPQESSPDRAARGAPRLRGLRR